MHKKHSLRALNIKITIYEQILKKKLKKSHLDFCIRMWLMAYKINICKPFRKMFDCFWIKSILMEKLLLLACGLENFLFVLIALKATLPTSNARSETSASRSTGM
jgi:hypothetical protein